jgi:putative transposase
MARALCIEFKNAFYHVMSRGLNRQSLFLDVEDFKFALYLLNEAQAKFKVIYHSYCLMNNHYHLYIQTPEANLSKIMKFINESYARYFLKKYPDKDGHVFKGRYKRKIVQFDLYSFQLSRYIHLNPVKAGLVKHPHEWEWSSYSSFIGLHAKASFLNTDWLLEQFSHDSQKAKELITQYTYEDYESNWNPEDYTLGKIILGSKDFFNYISNNYVRENDLNYDVLAAKEFTVSKIFDTQFIFSYVQKLKFDEAFKEKLLIYYLNEYTNLSLLEIGKLVNKTPKAIGMSHSRTKKLLKTKNLNELIAINK